MYVFKVLRTKNKITFGEFDLKNKNVGFCSTSSIFLKKHHYTVQNAVPLALCEFPHFLSPWFPSATERIWLKKRLLKVRDDNRQPQFCSTLRIVRNFRYMWHMTAEIISFICSISRWCVSLCVSFPYNDLYCQSSLCVCFSHPVPVRGGCADRRDAVVLGVSEPSLHWHALSFGESTKKQKHHSIKHNMKSMSG